MARTLTKGELRTRLEQLTDSESDAHLGTNEKDEILNSAMAETWDHIVAAGLAEKFVKSVSFSSVSGTLEYSFASVISAGVFYRIHALYVDEGSGQLRPLKRIAPAEVRPFRPPTSTVNLKLYYIPICPRITAGVGTDSTTFDGINGWEEHTL